MSELLTAPAKVVRPSLYVMKVPSRTSVEKEVRTSAAAASSTSEIRR